MTIGGALSVLNDLLNADDIPFFYKPSIKAVMDVVASGSMEIPTDSNFKMDLAVFKHLLSADDIPFYYKPPIKAVMDTIQTERCECEKDVLEIDLTALLNQLEKTGAGNIEVSFTKLEYPGREIYYGIREKREDEQGEDC